MILNTFAAICFHMRERERLTFHLIRIHTYENSLVRFFFLFKKTWTWSLSKQTARLIHTSHTYNTCLFDFVKQNLAKILLFMVFHSATYAININNHFIACILKQFSFRTNFSFSEPLVGFVLLLI